MANNVRIREPLSDSPTLEYLNERMAAGWKLVALEWEKPAEGEVPAQEAAEEIPTVCRYPRMVCAWWRILTSGRS